MNAGRETVSYATHRIARKLGVPRKRARMAVKKPGLKNASKVKGPRMPQENIAGRLHRCEKTNEMLGEERKPEKT